MTSRSLLSSARLADGAPGGRFRDRLVRLRGVAAAGDRGRPPGLGSTASAALPRRPTGDRFEALAPSRCAKTRVDAHPGRASHQPAASHRPAVYTDDHRGRYVGRLEDSAPLRDQLTVTGEHDRLGRIRRDVHRDLPATVVLERLGDELSLDGRHRRWPPCRFAAASTCHEPNRTTADSDSDLRADVRRRFPRQAVRCGASGDATRARRAAPDAASRCCPTRPGRRDASGG